MAITHKFHLCHLFYLVLSVSPLLAQTATLREGANLSVTSIEGDSTMGAQDLDLFAQVLEGKITAIGKYTLLERRNISAILSEQGFQQSGACNTSECQVEVGQLLGVEYIVSGQFRKTGSTWFLNFRITDVGSGKIVSSSNRSVSGDFGAVMSDGLSQVMQDLFGVVTRYTVSKPGYAGLVMQWSDDGSIIIDEVNGLGKAYEAGVRKGNRIVSINGTKPRPGQESHLGEAGALITLGIVQSEGQAMQQIALRLTDKSADDSVFTEWRRRDQGGAWTWIGAEFAVGFGMPYSLVGYNTLVRLSPFPRYNPVNLYVGASGLPLSTAIDPSVIYALELALNRTRFRAMVILSLKSLDQLGETRSFEFQTIHDFGKPSGFAINWGLGVTHFTDYDEGIRTSKWIPMFTPSVGISYRIGG